MSEADAHVFIGPSTIAAVSKRASSSVWISIDIELLVGTADDIVRIAPSAVPHEQS